MRASALLAGALALGLAGCAWVPAKKTVPEHAFDARELIQTPTQRLATLVMAENLQSLDRLLAKLYLRNPAAWRQGGHTSAEAAKSEVMFAIKSRLPLAPLGRVRAQDAIATAFEPAFEGDRAGTLVYGLGSMLMDAWEGERTPTLTDTVNAQKLANAAYNIEVAAWLLNHRADAAGRPLLVANERTADTVNLSFEREFGQMIGRTLLMATVSGEHLRRSAIGGAQAVATSTLLLPLSALPALP